jgi:hypothetical protein
MSFMTLLTRAKVGAFCYLDYLCLKIRSLFLRGQRKAQNSFSLSALCVSAVHVLLLIFILLFPANAQVFAGLNLEVPLEMVDLGLRSERRQQRYPSGVTDFRRSWIYLDPDDYDGATYYFEIVAKNTDSVNRNVNLKCTDNNTIYAQIQVAAGTTAFSRKRVSWNPSSPAAG